MYVLSCLWDHAYKRSLAANQRAAHIVVAGFLSGYICGPSPYVFSASLNKKLNSSFLLLIVIIL